MRIGVLKKRRVAVVAALVVSSQGWVWAVATNAASNQTVPPAPRFSTNTLISARIKWNLDLFGSQTNNGDGTFRDVGANFWPAAQGFAVWGDYDNDGDLDAAIAGQDALPSTRIHRNDGAGSLASFLSSEQELRPARRALHPLRLVFEKPRSAVRSPQSAGRKVHPEPVEGL